MKKIISKLLSFILVVSFVAGMLPVCVSASHEEFTLEGGADTDVVVTTDTDAGTITIGNCYIERTISIAGGKVKTIAIRNKRTVEIMGEEIVFEPGEGSEDFILNVSNMFVNNADPVAEQLIKTSDLTLVGEPQISKSEKTTMVTFTFAPFVKYDIPWSVVYNIVMKDGDSFMNSFLAISVPEEKKEEAYIISIDIDAFKFSGLDNSVLWAYKPHPSDASNNNRRNNRWGQPVYVNSLYFGIEFPFTDLGLNPLPSDDNNGQEKTLKLRYYSGKNFTQLKTNEAGQFVT